MPVMHKGVQPYHILIDLDLVYLVNITCAALRVDNPSPYWYSSDSGEDLTTIGANDTFATSNSPTFPCPIREDSATPFSRGGPSCSSLALPRWLGFY